MHQALTAHGLGTIFLTFLHISGQMGWKLMAQNSKAYSVTRGGGGEVITLKSHQPHMHRKELMGREASLLPGELT